jgi:hypothetical protein
LKFLKKNLDKRVKLPGISTNNQYALKTYATFQAKYKDCINKLRTESPRHKPKDPDYDMCASPDRKREQQ